MGFGFGNGTVKFKTAGTSQSPKRMLQKRVLVRVGMIRLRIVVARMGPSSAMKPVQTSAGASCNVCQLSIERFRKITDPEDNAPFCCDFYESFVAFVGEFLKNE